MQIDFTEVLKDFYQKKLLEPYKDIKYDYDYYRLLYIHVFTSGKYKVISDQIEQKYTEPQKAFQRLLELADYIGKKYTEQKKITPREYLEELIKTGELENFLENY